MQAKLGVVFCNKIAKTTPEKPCHLPARAEQAFQVLDQGAERIGEGSFAHINRVLVTLLFHLNMIFEAVSPNAGGLDPGRQAKKTSIIGRLRQL